MGLPMWRAPSPEPKSATKGDVTAPARSPIRRRSPPYPNARRARSQRSSLRSPRSLLDTDFIVSASRLSPISHSRSQPGHAPDRLRAPPNPWRLPPPPVPESPNSSRMADDAGDTDLSEINNWPDSRRRAQNYLRSFYQTQISSNSLPSPPRPHPAYTPNFAPAAAARRAGASRAYDTGPSADRLRSGRTASPAQQDNGSAAETVEQSENGGDTNAVNLPPLRRMGRRTVADGPLPASSLRDSMSPDSALDGLGDRDRSISPADDNDPWGTFLSTVAPDPLPPTADSSFTSAAASASFSNSQPTSRAGSANSNSASSSRTHLTVPSRHESPLNEQLRVCDTDSDTSTDSDHEEALLRARRRVRTQGVTRPPSAGLPLPVSAQRRRYRGLGDQLDGSAEDLDTAEQESGAREREMRFARAILQRVQREGYSEGFSDEIWASIGLPRSMADLPYLADRVERLNEQVEQLQRRHGPSRWGYPTLTNWSGSLD